MALSADLERAGLRAENIEARSTVTLDMSSGAPVINRVHVDVSARVPGASEDQFREITEGTKQNCPVSKVLSGGAQITMNARLA
jgi:osmotically inducible protein OsmC